jgi:hypothetical protein
MTDTASTLEEKLEEMLSIETFDPPQSFVAQANLNDPKVYEEADATGRAGGSARPRS